jgi:hypothetical protein
VFLGLSIAFGLVFLELGTGLPLNFGTSKFLLFIFLGLTILSVLYGVIRDPDPLHENSKNNKKE